MLWGKLNLKCEGSVENNRWRADIWNFSSRVQLDISRVRYRVDHEKNNSIRTVYKYLYILLDPKLYCVGSFPS